MHSRFSPAPVQLLVASLVLLLLTTACPGPGDDGGAPTEAIPEEVVRFNNLGTAFLSQQEWGDAEQEFKKGLELRADDPVLLNNSAVALLQQGERVEEAEALLTKALETDANNRYAHYNMGLLQKSRGEFEAAVTHFQAVADADPGEVFTQYNLGSALSQVDRLDDAETSLRKALELDASHVSSLYALGRLLLRKGEQDEGSTLIERSQTLRANGIPAVGTQYGEAGPYAMGVSYPSDRLTAPDPIEVAFSLMHGPPSGADQRPAMHAVFLSGDGHPGLIGPKEGDAAGGNLVAVVGPEGPTLTLPEGHQLRAMASGDLDGDRALDYAILMSRGGETMLRIAGGDANWMPALPLSPGPADGDLCDLALVDKDHDGDLDVMACWSGAGATCALWTNDGKAGLTLDAPDFHKIAIDAPDGPISIAFSDVDNDRDIDLLVGGPKGVHLFSNVRDGSFADLSDDAGMGGILAETTSISFADFDKDGQMDLLAGRAGNVRVLWNDRGRFTETDALPGFASSGDASACDGGNAIPMDYDNDGFVDIAASNGVCETVFIRNLGGRQWTESFRMTREGGLTPLMAMDADADGDLDLGVAGKDVYALLRNDGGNANNWLALDMLGVGDNKRGIGTKVDVLSGALRQKFEITEPLPLHAGLGNREEADAVRLLWPGGVLQDEINKPANTPTDIEQLDRKGTSCPLLYAWRDGEWQFVTDFLGGAAIGYQQAPGKFNMPDTDEYILLEGGLEAEDGTLRVRLNNQLEEVIWFDQAELVVIDHPAGSQVFPNERLMPGPPWTEYALYASPTVREAAGAREVETGRDVLERLRERDRRYVDGFELLPFKGYAETHTLELNLGEVQPGERVVLLLDGWIDYADSSANIGAVQAELSLVPPQIHVPAGNGWKLAEERMGFPAGLPKTMTVDVTEMIDPADPRVRIETNMRIYWDKARVMVGGADTELDVTRVPVATAELRPGGFPRSFKPDGKKPPMYDPSEVAPAASWKAHVGAYTGFGDVTALLGAIDDQFVTTRNGDEVELRFAAPAAPAAGMERTYLLYADGFGKDMDPNSAANNTIWPLPFHGMPYYPYGPEVERPMTAEVENPGYRVVTPSMDGMPGAYPVELATRNAK
ncbi:hypothetical protein ABI59_10955 [Acidobacteria bacterium Mor1]|nr:hypothetical protein ABI59_10955 [Acidobacteria bacterium Mor1]